MRGGSLKRTRSAAEEALAAEISVRDELCLTKSYPSVSGHGSSHAAGGLQCLGLLAPAMSRPVRNAHSSAIPAHRRTFFATTKTSMGRRMFQSEPNAVLLVDVLRSCLIEREFKLHDFVIMPDHVHLLITVDGKMTIEKAMQLIKGRFSYRMKRERGYLGDVWQGGFSEVRVEDRESFSRHIEYIAQNPVKAGLVSSSEEYPYCYRSLVRVKAQGLKPEP